MLCTHALFTFFGSQVVFLFSLLGLSGVRMGVRTPRNWQGLSAEGTGHHLITFLLIVGAQVPMEMNFSIH